MRSLLLILPMLAGYLLFSWHIHVLKTVRESVMKSAVVWMTLLIIMTELLSLMRGFRLAGILAGWAMTVVTLILLMQRRGIPLFWPAACGFPDRGDWLFAAVIGGITGVTCLTGLAAPPNTWDSMTYHMARIPHWIQNASVHHYATHILRQLYQPPGAEYIIAHTYILSGSDRFANSVQWFAMLGSLVGVSLIGRELGLGRRGQQLAAVIAATIPMGVLQASSTQNDYVLAFWITALVFFCYRAAKSQAGSDLVMAGLSCGIAVLIKGTAYVYALPILLLFGAFFLFRHPRSVWKIVLAVAASVLLINAGHYTRNMQVFGNPIGGHGTPYHNEIFTPKALVSNLVRNVAMHFYTPSGVFSRAVEDRVRRVFGTMNISWNDPKTTWPGTAFGLWHQTWRHEDNAGNFFHTLAYLTAALLGMLIVARRFSENRELGGYLLLCVGTFLFFSLYLKWQPWHSRLHVPQFVLCAPLLAAVVSRIPCRPVFHLLIAALAVQAVPYAFFNHTRPLLGEHSILKTPRAAQYFSSKPAYAKKITETVTVLQQDGRRTIGLWMSENQWEYPFWALSGIRKPLEMRHINVDNPSAKLETPFTPEVIVAMRPEKPDRIILGRRVYTADRQIDDISLYRLDLLSEPDGAGAGISGGEQ